MNSKISPITLGNSEIDKVIKKHEMKLYNIELEERKLWQHLQKQRNSIPTLLSRLHYLAKNKIAQLKKDHERGLTTINQKFYPRIQKNQLKLSKIQSEYQKKLDITKKKISKQLKNSKLETNSLKNFESEKNKIQVFYDVKQDEIRAEMQKIMNDNQKEISNFGNNIIQKNKVILNDYNKYLDLIKKEIQMST